MCMKRSRVPTKNSLEYTSESDFGAGLLAQVGKVEVDGREWNDENGVSRGESSEVVGSEVAFFVDTMRCDAVSTMRNIVDQGNVKI